MFKTTFILGIGMSLGPLIQWLATPWLARAYAPDAFGQLAVFMAISVVISGLSCMRHDAAILVVQDSEVDATAQLALCYALAVAIIGGTLVTFFAPQIFGEKYSVLAENRLQLILSIVGAAVVLIGAALSMRHEKYTISALLRVIQGTMYVLLALSVMDGLINAWSTAWVIAGVVSLAYLIINRRICKARQLLNQAVILKDYSLNLTLTFFLDSLALVLPILFINYYYGLAEVGSYSQVSKLIGAPILLVSALIGQIFFQKSGKYYRSNQSSLGLFKICIFVLASLAIILLITIIFFGHYLADLILGEGWRTETIYLVMISIPILFKAVVSPITTVFLTHGRTKALAFWQLIYFVLTLIILITVTLFKTSFETFLIIYAVSEVFLYSIYGLLAFKVIQDTKFGVKNESIYL
jgi:O-antigen/teichoic acid export membrane protein